MTDAIGSGSLKLVSGWSASRPLDPVLGQVLSERVGANDIRKLRGGVFVVYSEADPADIRSWLAELLLDSESVFVVEFERWSSHGADVDWRWLMRRGH